MEKIRLAKALAESGVASRRKCETLIFEGHVTVNGKRETTPQTLINPQRDVILVDGERVRMEKKVYFLLNKPAGYLCSNTRPNKNSKIVFDLFEGISTRLFTVGRLDKETTGLLLITNDGDFANRVIHPSANISKEYLAKTSQEISDTHLKALSAGTTVENTFVKPVKVTKVRRGTVKITVKEGKKREVRHLLANAGLDVLELKRLRIGPLTLGDLPLGAYRRLTPQELNNFL